MRKVVVVEDEDLVRRGIVLAVDWASVDCTVVAEAGNGEDGMDVIRSHSPDLIVTDIRMPKLDGLEMISRLRAEGNGASVIFLSAYSDFAYAQKALRLGAADYLLKPFRDGELERATAAILSRTREEGQPPHDPRLVGFPLLPSDKPLSRYVTEALSYITENYKDPEISVSTIARSLDLSESHLSHVFKKESGHNISSCLTGYRMYMAMQLLQDVRSKVYEVAEKVGYRDITYFSSTFKKAVGCSPSEYQRRGGQPLLPNR